MDANACCDVVWGTVKVDQSTPASSWGIEVASTAGKAPMACNSHVASEVTSTEGATPDSNTEAARGSVAPRADPGARDIRPVEGSLDAASSASNQVPRAGIGASVCTTCTAMPEAERCK